MGASVEKTMFIFSYLTILTVSACGNTLLILATIRNPKLRSFTNILICNSAISDILIIVFSLPFQIYGFVEHEHLLVVCQIKVFTAITSFTLSNTNLLLVTFDRFFNIHWPLKYKTMSVKKLKMGISSSWLFSSILGIFPFAIIGEREIDSKYLESTRCNFSVILQYEYILSIELGNFVPVWCIIVCLNAMLLRKIYKSKKKDIRAQHYQGNETAEENQRLKAFLRELKYAKVICLTVGIYTLCMAPIILINTLKVFVPFLDVKSTGFRVMLLFLYLCPALNPLVYGLKMSSYRKEFKRYLPCKVTN